MLRRDIDPVPGSGRDLSAQRPNGHTRRTPSNIRNFRTTNARSKDSRRAAPAPPTVSDAYAKTDLEAVVSLILQKRLSCSRPESSRSAPPLGKTTDTSTPSGADTLGAGVDLGAGGLATIVTGALSAGAAGAVAAGAGAGVGGGATAGAGGGAAAAGGAGGVAAAMLPLSDDDAMVSIFGAGGGGATDGTGAGL